MHGYNNNHNQARENRSALVRKIVKDVFGQNPFKNWDRVRPQSECLHCHGTGRAPSADGRTECGFCEKDK